MVKFIQRFYLLIILLFLYLPILLLMVFSFNSSRVMGIWTGFTVQAYIDLFADRSILQALYYTFAVAVLATIIATMAGTVAAIGIHSLSRYPRGLVMNLSYLPVINPDIVTGISLMILFVFVQLPLGFFTMLIAHIVFNIPYVIFSVLPKLRQLNPNTYEAALDLGATPFYAITRVIIPEIKSGIWSGAILAFTLSIDDFVISFFTTGQGVQNLSTLIYSMARRGISPKINALSTLMFVVVLTLLIITNRDQNKIKKKKGAYLN